MKKSNLKFWLKRVSKTLRKVIICLFLRTLFVFWITQIRDRYFYWLTSPCECLEDLFLWFFKKNRFSQKECEIFFNIESAWSLFLVNRAFFNAQKNAHFFHNEWYWKSTLVLKCNFMKHFMVLVIYLNRQWLMFKN